MAYNKKEVLQVNTEASVWSCAWRKNAVKPPKLRKVSYGTIRASVVIKCVLNRTDTPDDIRYWSKSEQNLFEPTQQLKQMIYREALDANTASGIGRASRQVY